jgi:hypothetical protein
MLGCRFQTKEGEEEERKRAKDDQRVLREDREREREKERERLSMKEASNNKYGTTILSFRLSPSSTQHPQSKLRSDTLEADAW